MSIKFSAQNVVNSILCVIFARSILSVTFARRKYTLAIEPD